MKCFSILCTLEQCKLARHDQFDESLVEFFYETLTAWSFGGVYTSYILLTFVSENQSTWTSYLLGG